MRGRGASDTWPRAGRRTAPRTVSTLQVGGSRAALRVTGGEGRGTGRHAPASLRGAGGTDYPPGLAAGLPAVEAAPGTRARFCFPSRLTLDDPRGLEVAPALPHPGSGPALAPAGLAPSGLVPLRILGPPFLRAREP